MRLEYNIAIVFAGRKVCTFRFFVPNFGTPARTEVPDCCFAATSVYSPFHSVSSASSAKFKMSVSWDEDPMKHDFLAPDNRYSIISSRHCSVAYRKRPCHDENASLRPKEAPTVGRTSQRPSSSLIQSTVKAMLESYQCVQAWGRDPSTQWATMLSFILYNLYRKFRTGRLLFVRQPSRL